MGEALRPKVEYEVEITRRETTIEPRKDWRQVTTTGDRQYDYVVAELPVTEQTVILKAVLPSVNVQAIIAALYPPEDA